METELKKVVLDAVESPFGGDFTDGMSIDAQLARIKSKYDWMVRENERLKQENEDLRNDVWKDGEMARMKEEYDRMRKEYGWGFPLSEEERKKIGDFLNGLRDPNRKLDSLGGCVEYRFCPTGLGTVGEVIVTKNGKEHRFVFREIG